MTHTPKEHPLARRQLLLAAALAGLCLPARGHDLLGPVTPARAAPALPLQLHDGRQTQLPTLLQGRVTALQLMFTGCSAVCPVQGAVFASLQAKVLTPSSTAQLLSLSIDPLGDDPKALERWRRQFGAGARWLAAVPPVRHADVMLDFVSGRPPGRATGDRHTAQVYLFDTKGQLAFRCAEFASAADIALAVEQLQRRA